MAGDLDFLNNLFDDNYEKVTSKVRLGSTTKLSANSTFTPAQSKPSDPLADAVDKATLLPTSSDAVDKASLLSTSPDGVLGEEGTKLSALSKARLGVLGAQFITDLMNADSAYRTTSTAVQQNLMLSKLNQEDAMYRGRQKAMDQRSQGNLNADEAMMNLAAQGIDISGAGAENIIEGYRSMGAYAAMREEMNMYREAFKYGIEQIQLEMQGEMAGINRDIQVMNSLMNTGVNAAFAIKGEKKSLWD